MLSERAGRGEGNSAAIGVPEGKFFRMQQQAVCGSKRFAFGVKLVAEDHMANRFHMHAQLVRAARQGKEPQPGRALAAIEHLPACLRGLAVLVIDTMTRLVVGINRQRQVDEPFVFFNVPQTMAI